MLTVNKLWGGLYNHTVIHLAHYMATLLIHIFNFLDQEIPENDLGSDLFLKLNITEDVVAAIGDEVQSHKTIHTVVHKRFPLHQDSVRPSL